MSAATSCRQSIPRSSCTSNTVGLPRIPACLQASFICSWTIRRFLVRSVWGLGSYNCNRSNTLDETQLTLCDKWELHYKRLHCLHREREREYCCSLLNYYFLSSAFPNISGKKKSSGNVFFLRNITFSAPLLHIL